jgi:hypothetical protein
MVLIFLFYKDDLGRHLGNYFLTYSVSWVLSVVTLLFASFKMMEQPTVLKIIMLGIFIGYLSVVLAHVFAVVLDVSNIRGVHKSISIDELVIPLVFPFIVLRGWMFSVLFIPFVLLLNRYTDAK